MHEDIIWNAFGFSKRPKRGSLFHVFVPKEKFKNENFLLREIWVISFSRCVYWSFNTENILYRDVLIGKLIELMVDGLEYQKLKANFLLFLRYSDKYEALKYLCNGCLQYLSIDFNSHGALFLNRYKKKINIEIPVNFVIGSELLFSDPRLGITPIIPALTSTDISIIENDIIINNKNYQKVAENIFHKLNLT